MPTLVLGNTAPLQVWKPDDKTTDVKSKPAEIDNGRDDNYTETTFTFPPSTPVGEALQQVQAIWLSHHSAEPPAWVDSDDEALAKVVAGSFGAGEREVRVGRPRGWEHGPTAKSGGKS